MLLLLCFLLFLYHYSDFYLLIHPGLCSTIQLRFSPALWLCSSATLRYCSVMLLHHSTLLYSALLYSTLLYSAPLLLLRLRRR